MNRLKRLSFIILLVIAIFLAKDAIQKQQSVTKEEYVTQVLDQYIKYYCPNADVCSRKKALERLRRDWPHVYQAGFYILEDEKN